MQKISKKILESKEILDKMKAEYHLENIVYNSQNNIKKYFKDEKLRRVYINEYLEKMKILEKDNMDTMVSPFDIFANIFKEKVDIDL